MKRVLWMVLLIAVLALSSCAPTQTATPLPASPAVTQTEAKGVIASGVVVPMRTSDLSFVISAAVKELVVNEGDVVEAGQTLMTLDSPALAFNVTQAEAALRAAEFRHQYWIPARFDRPPERRQLAEAELVIAQKAFETAQANLTVTTLSAPFAGTVISLQAQPGEFVQSGQVVLTLADLGALQIETTDLSERDIASVSIGQTAQVYIEALDQEFHGAVTSIAPKATTVGGDVVYKVTITLDEQPAGLLWGMNAEVEINTED